MRVLETIAAFVFLAAAALALHAAEPDSDAPEQVRDPALPFKAAASYERALEAWSTPEDIAAWIAAHFEYDLARAMRLSETQRAATPPPPIHAPEALFALPSGVCVDLARFGVETLGRIDPGSTPRYLRIEFDPVRLAGNTLRVHWLASFERGGKRYFFADSKRPGTIAGPYADAAEFVREYAQYRGRSIVAFRELASYQKQRRALAAKRDARAERPDGE